MFLDKLSPILVAPSDWPDVKNSSENYANPDLSWAFSEIAEMERV